ncbi:flavodoxin-dependent (E)-4-hydroxy-3-methylbut-2-enyl-diphosphate synthase, partial [bacterium]|nr:flavodoxin-dependent (E)-4-hydroxy-3-methylbut-2-enyl-diphosphate synthase [bacterium]
MQRRNSKQILIGNVKIGGNAPISVQSMTNTDTRDVESTLKQIYNLYDQGCELIRLAVLNADAADAIKEIKKKSPIPIIADIHFDYRLAIRCIENGVDALRINPGNIGKEEHTQKVVKLAKINNVPIRIGINGGSLEKELEQLNIPLHEKMVMSAMRHIRILEDNNFDKIKISLKSSDVLTTIEAYRLIAKKVDYPLHLGVTEAGTYTGGIVKSAVGLGTLLSEGIGDTIRVSLTDSPIEEVKAGYLILKSLNLRQRGINFISCPTCGRTQINLISLAKEVEKRLENFNKPLTIAVMGCAVNGPG